MNNGADVARPGGPAGRRGVTAKLRIVAVVLLSASALLASPVSTALAQNPSHTGRMENVSPGGGYPGTDAVVVEGLGATNGCPPDVSAIEHATVAFLNAGHKTITEISPQSYCDSLGGYEDNISRIAAYVQANAANVTADWGGFMLDEEPGFGFNVTNLEALNDYTKNLVNHIIGVAWWWTENQPTGWGSLANYNYLVGNSYASPQVYNQNFADEVNRECSTYGMCTNNVTTELHFPSPWNRPDYTTSLIHGGCVNVWFIYWTNLFN